jgi:hypothetical protein
MQRCPPTFTASIDGVSVACDDLHHQLTVRGRRLTLPTQVYLFARALVMQARACEAEQVPDRVVSHAELCQETGAPDLVALRVLAFEARADLRPRLLIINEYGRGYSIRGVGNGS